MTASPSPTVAPRGLAQLALFDEIECGLILCDGEGLIQFSNHAASEELARASVLVRVGDRLRRAAEASGDLEEALLRAAQRGRRTLVRLGHRGDSLMVSTLPAPQEDGTVLVLVMLGRRQPCSDLGLEMLASSYGLTLAERRVLGALMREATPRQIAVENAVAMSTVRTQISSIRAKFGARSIEVLMLRAAQVPPVAGALRAAAVPPRAPLARPGWMQLAAG